MATAKKEPKLDELMYKGRPLIRRGNVMYYGFLDDKFIVKIEIKDSEVKADLNNLNVSTKVNVQLTTNNTKLQGSERMIMKSQKDSLYAAIDLGNVWLEDSLDENQ